MNAARSAGVLALALSVTALASCGTDRAGAGPATSGSRAGAQTQAPSPTMPSTSRTSSTPITGTTPATLTGAAFLIASIDPSRLPTTEEGVRQLVARMPATMGGKAATKRDKREVKYADGTRFVVESETTAAPGMSMEQFFPIFLSHGGFTVTAQSKPGASLLWFVAHGRPPYQAHLAGVASPTETWLFGVDAASSAACDDLVAALAAAVR